MRDPPYGAEFILTVRDADADRSMKVALSEKIYCERNDSSFTKSVAMSGRIVFNAGGQVEGAHLRSSAQHVRSDNEIRL